MGYFTSAGPAYGPLRYRDVAGTIDVMGTSDPSSPIGTAFCTGANTAGVATWRVSIGGRDLPGQHVVLHRRFRPA